MFVDSPSALFNLERFRGQGIEHLVVNRGNAGLGTVSICLICVALVTTMDMLGTFMTICHMCISHMVTVIISVRLLFIVPGRVSLWWGP